MMKSKMMEKTVSKSRQGLLLIGGACLTTALAVLSGCHDSGEKGSLGGADPAARIQGAWSTGACVETSTPGMFGKRVLDFKGGDVAEYFTVFSDAQCSKPLFEVQQGGGFHVGNAPAGSDGAPSIDYQVE